MAMAWYMRAQQDSMPLRIRRIVRGDSHESVDCIDSPVRPLPGCGGRVDGKEERWGLPACLAQRHHLCTACTYVCDPSCFGAKSESSCIAKTARSKAFCEKRTTVLHQHGTAAAPFNKRGGLRASSPTEMQLPIVLPPHSVSTG